MVDANAAICAKDTAANASGVAFALEMADVLLRGWGEVHAGRGNDEGEGESGAGLALAFVAVADV